MCATGNGRSGKNMAASIGTWLDSTRLMHQRRPKLHLALSAQKIPLYIAGKELQRRQAFSGALCTRFYGVGSDCTLCIESHSLIGCQIRQKRPHGRRHSTLRSVTAPQGSRRDTNSLRRQLYSRNICLRDDVPRSHVLLQTEVYAPVLLQTETGLGLLNTLLKAVFCDFVHELSCVGDGQLLADLVLELLFELL